MRGPGPAASRKGWRAPYLFIQLRCSWRAMSLLRAARRASGEGHTKHECNPTKVERPRAAAISAATEQRRQSEAELRTISGARSRSAGFGRRDRDGELLPARGALLPRSEG